MEKDTRNFAVIVSGGAGQRMGAREKKQYLKLGTMPVLSRTISVFAGCQFVDEIVLVIPAQDHDFCLSQIIEPLNLSRSVHLVEGGKERHDSVYNGVKKANLLADSTAQNLVLIHDGVRPFAEPALIQKCLDQAAVFGACIPGIQLTDTVKKVDASGCVISTLDRKFLFAAQTPQVFKLDLLLNAFDHARHTGFLGTDDASFVEHLGHPVRLVKGSKFNIKLTTPEDLVFARQILDQAGTRRKE
jgi:2-C-methyl-D-erythritol 4-phosphate cytidylyltransferase